jgi:aerobic-type carbon monoxide dehydrogenase small subunit (CoxS/CutS family)
MILNGRQVALDALPHHTLLDVLRNQAGLTGTKECCDAGECGACTVLLNGRAVTSCLVLAAEVADADVVTVEGLARDGHLDPLQQAFIDCGAVQCGFCIPGMIVAAKYLLNTNPHPTDEEIRDGLAGNLCRCGGYSRIIEAVHVAAAAGQPGARSAPAMERRGAMGSPQATGLGSGAKPQIKS